MPRGGRRRRAARRGWPWAHATTRRSPPPDPAPLRVGGARRDRSVAVLVPRVLLVDVGPATHDAALEEERLGWRLGHGVLTARLLGLEVEQVLRLALGAG